MTIPTAEHVHVNMSHSAPRWRISKYNRKVLVAKDDIRAARLAYSRDTSRYRNEGWPMSKRMFTSDIQKGQSWRDGKNEVLPASVSKGQGVIILHAGSENGFIPNALLMFKFGDKIW
jgi:hypothetical protein